LGRRETGPSLILLISIRAVVASGVCYSGALREGPSRVVTPLNSDYHWVKSSLSFSNGNCVEVASLSDGEIGVRNSRDAGGTVLRFTPDEWHAFLGGVRNGEFDSFGKN
jgi:Domain of unknown function (DUF397)